MKLVVSIFTITTLLLLNLVHAQRTKPIAAKEPAWISKRSIDYNKNSLDKEASDGYIEMVFENQVNLADQSEYYRLCKKILSQSGVQNASQISISFNPEYQQLIFHSIKIIRNNNSIDKLKLANIKTVQQEEDLDDFIYNGSRDAILILDDIRPGDYIEYSYTLQGYNPIFKNKYADWYRFNFATPVYDIYYKLIVPPGRKLNFKKLNTAPDPVATNQNGQQVFEWNKKEVPPLKMQDFTPSWYTPYAAMQVSEYNSWKEVNDWAMELFPLNKQLAAAVKDKISEIERSCSTDEAKTKMALQFVQDDIRYMGIEIGVHSHKPADPSKVFSQRFGDCKEKSYLLCCMLNAMHIEAAPVLISTADKKELNNELPTPTNFNHATVRVKLGNTYYYYDPTIAFQRGDIKDLFYPDYQAGLVVTPNTTDLTSIKFRDNSYQHVKEYFKAKDMGGDGSLVVTSIFKGEDADNTRDEFHNSSVAEMMTTYQKFYAGYFDDIRIDSLTYKDNDSTGIFETKEYYSIPKFWSSDNNNMKFYFSTFVINGIIRRIKEKQRTMPFSLNFPVTVKENIVIELPKNWPVSASNDHIRNECFVYDYDFYNTDNIVHLDATYKNLKDHATASEAREYLKDLNVYDDASSFRLSTGDETTVKKEVPSSRTTNNLVSIIVLGTIIGGVTWWRRRNMR